LWWRCSKKATCCQGAGEGARLWVLLGLGLCWRQPGLTLLICCWAHTS
jgi:hypothetical protein